MFYSRRSYVEKININSELETVTTRRSKLAVARRNAPPTTRFPHYPLEVQQLADVERAPRFDIDSAARQVDSADVVGGDARVAAGFAHRKRAAEGLAAHLARSTAPGRALRVRHDDVGDDLGDQLIGRRLHVAKDRGDETADVG